MIKLVIVLSLALMCNFALNTAEPTSTEFGMEEPVIIQTYVGKRKPAADSGDLLAKLRQILAKILRWIAG